MDKNLEFLVRQAKRLGGLVILQPNVFPREPAVRLSLCADFQGEPGTEVLFLEDELWIWDPDNTETDFSRVTVPTTAEELRALESRIDVVLGQAREFDYAMYVEGGPE